MYTEINNGEAFWGNEVIGSFEGLGTIKGNLEFDPTLWTPHYLCFDLHLPSIRSQVLFTCNDKTEFKLRLQAESLSGDSAYYKYVIESVSTKQKNAQFFVRTSLVTRLLYYPDEIEILGFTFQKKEVSLDKTYVNNPSLYYFEAELSSIYTTEDLESAISILSIVTCTFLGIGVLSEGLCTTYYNFRSQPTLINFYGSGVLHHPIKKSAMENLFKKIGFSEFQKLQWRFSNFVTAKDPIYQLFKGCNLLEFILESTPLKSKPKSKNLIKLLNKLNLPEDEQKLLCTLYPSINWDTSSNFVNNENLFDFFALRDNHVHRGALLTTDSDYQEYNNAIVALSEIVSITMAHLVELELEFPQLKVGEKAIVSAEYIELRQKTIYWNNVAK